MEWLEGETLGARIVRAPRGSARIRPRLARQCGEMLARIHSIDVEATGLGRRCWPGHACDQYVAQTWARLPGSFETPSP